ncbi:MAG: radical SAM protein [Thermoplasmatota archaeon]
MPADYRNDAMHPTLSRARPLQQVTLDRLETGRTNYGGCQVLESSGAGGLTDFTMGKSVSGECWSANPYSGCAHACSYCYVPDTIHAERRRWGSYVIVKRDLPTRIAMAVQKSKKMTVFFSTATDPYQPAEAEHEITRRCLEVLVRKDWPVEVLTRSPLVTRDIDLFRQFSQVRVGLSVPTVDDQVRRVLEPSAPPIAARLAALQELSNAGIPTFANYTPACPSTIHDAEGIARVLLDAGAHWANTSPWRRRSTTLGPVWERLRGTEWEGLTKFFSSKEAQREWQRELRQGFKKIGLPLGTSFFNAPFEWLEPGMTHPTEFPVKAKPTRDGVLPIPLPMAR